MLDGKLARIYEWLWVMGDDEEPPVAVVYHFAPAFRGPHAGAAALFMIELNGRPHHAIWVSRPKAPSQQDEADVSGADIAELISLAHERGHERSWRAGTYKAMSMEEEHRAWSHAEDILRSHGFDQWTVFAEHKTTSLGEHERRGTQP